MNKKELVRTLKFIIFSTGAGIIQTISFTLLNTCFPNESDAEGYGINYFISLVLSVLFNFTVNRKYTFKSANNVPVAMMKVGFFYLIFTPVSLWAGAYYVGKGVNEYVVFALTMLSNLILEFLYTKYIVYHNAIDSAVKKEDETQDEEAV